MQLAEAPQTQTGHALSLPADFDVRWFEKNRIGFGNPRPQAYVVRDLINFALTKLELQPIPTAASFGELDVESLRIVQKNFSLSRTGEVVRVDESSKERGIPPTGVCGLPSIQLLLKIAGFDSAAMSHPEFIRKTVGKWDLSHVAEGQPDWIASDYPLHPAIRSGMKLAPFRSGLRGIGTKYGLEEEEVMRLLCFESGADPRARNRHGAEGYIQFLRQTRADLRRNKHPFTYDPIGQLSLVDAYLNKNIGGRTSQLGGLVGVYQAILGPKFIGQEQMYQSPSRQYMANRWLDVDGDGIISRSDLDKVLSLYWYPKRPK